jgi:hypothetical protein
MNNEQIGRMIAAVCGPVIREVADQFRAEIKAVKEIDREQLAVKIAPIIDAYVRDRVSEIEVRLDARMKLLEQRFQAPRRVA